MINFKDEVVVRQNSHYPEELAFVTENPVDALIVQKAAQSDEDAGAGYEESLVVMLPPDILLEPGDEVILDGKNYEVLSARACMNLLGKLLAWRVSATR